MNPGSTNKPKTPTGVDAAVERLNRKIGRLLGKKSNLPPPVPDKTSNFTFISIVIGFTLLLWFATGFYYLPENQYGLVLNKGIVVDVVKGMKVGFTKPYPFGDLAVVDGGVSDFIGVSGITTSQFIVLSRNLTPLDLDAKFSYQVTDPVLVFNNILQKQSNLDNISNWEVQAKLHKYFVDKTSSDILKTNLTVAAGEVKNMANRELAPLGLKIIKLNINSLSAIAVRESSPVLINKPQPEILPTQPVALQLIQSANQYHENVLAMTRVDIDSFNQLLPQYQQTPDAIVKEMYYNALAAIPTDNPATQYPLLNMNLSDLILLGQTSPTPITEASAPIPLRERHFDRSVNRSRNSDPTLAPDTDIGDKNNGS